MNHLAVLASGNGSNLQAIIDTTESGMLPDTRVSVVVSDRISAYALQRAAQYGIAALYHPFLPYRKAGRTRREYDADLAAKLRAFPVDLVVLAGWMRVFTMDFLRHWPDRVLNIHPALPGAFPGTHAIQRAYEAFRRGELDHTGVMVHLVPDEGVDEGPVVVQESVPILDSDTLDDLEQRIHAVEHRLYVQAIAKILAALSSRAAGPRPQVEQG